jgi:predicted kinase
VHAQVHPVPGDTGGRSRSSGRPRAILVCGAPGSGKSTVGALVARRLRAALLDLDTATASLTAVISALHGTDDLDEAELVRLTRAARYEALSALAEDNLAVGVSVVLVAPFTTERRDPRAWEHLRRRMAGSGGDACMVWLRIPADEVLRRVEQRGAARDLAKLRRDWPADLDLDPPAVPHLEVDALGTPASIAEAVVSSVRQGR